MLCLNFCTSFNVSQRSFIIAAKHSEEKGIGEASISVALFVPPKIR